MRRTHLRIATAIAALLVAFGAAGVAGAVISTHQVIDETIPVGSKAAKIGVPLTHQSVEVHGIESIRVQVIADNTLDVRVIQGKAPECAEPADVSRSYAVAASQAGYARALVTVTKRDTRNKRSTVALLDRYVPLGPLSTGEVPLVDVCVN